MNALSPEGWEREAARILPEATRVVEEALGEHVPPVRVITADYPGMAFLRVAASGHPGKPRHWHAALRQVERELRDQDGAVATFIPGDAPVIALHAGSLDSFPGGLLAVLVHELTHAVQMCRPGHRERWLADEASRLDCGRLPLRRMWSQPRELAALEDEAYRVQGLAAECAS